MRLMQRLFPTHTGHDHYQSARRALRRLRIAILVWMVLLATTVLWFVLIP